MNKDQNLDEIKSQWEQEKDKYVLKAATEDLDEYSPEIQAIIKEEALRRGLVKEEQGKVVLVKEANNKIASKPEPTDSVKYAKPWLAKTQIYIGETMAGIMALLGIYTLIAFFSRITEFPLPHWSSNTSLSSLLGTVISIILSVSYFSAIRKRKVKVVQQIYRTWWIISVALFGIIFFGLVIFGRWTESTNNLMTCIMILFCIAVPLGLITLLWWLGLRGLKQLCGKAS
jgi:hypothetical protein